MSNETILSLSVLCEQCNKQVAVLFYDGGLAIVEEIGLQGPIYIEDKKEFLKKVNPKKEAVFVQHATICWKHQRALADQKSETGIA